MRDRQGMGLLAQIETQTVDYSGFKMLLPLSGGINSAACLCWLLEEVSPGCWPSELHVHYSHFKEHSPDTFKFVADLIRYARTRYPAVKSTILRNSVNKYFIDQKMIPHPTISPCSRELKVIPARNYFQLHDLDIELIGYVNTDQKRFRNLSARTPHARFPVLEWSKQDCLDYVKAVIGWYPAIYDIKDENGKDVFSHNNCLPCKNMHPKQLKMVAKYYPDYARKAEKTAAAIPGAYWGREDIPEVFKCDVCVRLD